MRPRAGHPVAGERLSGPLARDAAADYGRLLATLASRARRLGSRDPEGAAQEALKRSLENANSQPAIEYYFSDDLPAGANPPEWPLDQLFAWLHGVLHNVVREEHYRVSSRREVPIAWQIQVRAQGDISDRARQRALEIADHLEFQDRGEET